MKEKMFFSVDPVVFTLSKDNLLVLLIEQAVEPFKGQYRLPGGLIDIEKSGDLDGAAAATLLEKTGIQARFFEQLKTYGGITRDPRGWTVSTAYMGVINYENVKTENMAPNAQWMAVDEALTHDLAFDHSIILKDAVARLKNKVNYSLLPAKFLPEEFTMSALQKIYEQILGEKLDKSSFIKKIREADAIEEVEGKYQEGNFRPAQIWRLKNLHHFDKNMRPRM